jgi:hypothetical protein
MHSIFICFVKVRRSGIDHVDAGLGVHLRGVCVMGTLLCIYPGMIFWPGMWE